MKESIPINLSGGMSNTITPLELWVRGKGECESLINTDMSKSGTVKPIWPLTALHATPEGSAIHSIFRANNVEFVGASTTLKYRVGTALVSLFTGLSGAKISFTQVGNIVFMCNGTDKKAIYLSPLIDVVKSGTYKWTASGSGTGEYYCELAAGGNPSLNEPSKLYESSTEMTIGTMGSLALNEWDWGDNDTLGYNTIYARITGGVDPDTKSDGYLEALTPNTPQGCNWGLAIPSAGPTVAAGAAGNPSGTYTCYYRYKITLPDDSVLYTALSAISSDITVTSQKIEWSNIVHATFTGAKKIQAELFRTKTGFASTYYIATLDSGTTVYSDNLSDVDVQTQIAYAETGYWNIPNEISLLHYNPAADRIFMAAKGDAYWTEAGLYHTVVYDETAGAYENVNSVFLGDEEITAMVMLDENSYFSSNRTWMRLRGRSPDSWLWEPTSSIKGPINQRSTVIVAQDVIFPANDGGFWRFNGFDSSRFLQEYKLATTADANAHATFDGRYCRFFYKNPTTYSEIVVDFYGPESSPIRVFETTRQASASFFNKETSTLYIADTYLKSGDLTTGNVVVTIKTPEIPVEGLINYGGIGSLYVRCNTGSDNLVVTPYYDGVAGTPYTARVNAAKTFEKFQGQWTQYHTIAFSLALTTNSTSAEIEVPLILSEGD